MTQAMRLIRRNRVDERAAIALAIVGGIIAATAGARPTGSAAVDVLLVAVVGTLVIWASASASWWATATAAGVGAVIGFSLVPVFAGALGFLGGLHVGIRRRDDSEIRAVVGALAINSLIRSDLEGFFGLSALIGVPIGAALLVMGVRRRPSRIRGVAWRTTAVVGAAVVLALLGLAIAGAVARNDLRDSTRTARQGVDALNAGDYDGAAVLFQQASDGFGRADGRLSGLATLPARLIPGVAQNTDAGAELAAAAERATGDAADALRRIDAESLEVIGGAIAIDAVRAVEQPLRDVKAALEVLRADIDSVESPWLIDAVQAELADLETELDENEPRLENAIEAVRLAPRLLGAEGQRRYLVLFTSPAEARGLGGFVGNYAEITIVDGRISVAEFARRSELETAVQIDPAFCTGCPPELLDRYGRFGFTTGPNDSMGGRGWSNITMPAHFPYVAESAAILYPQSGGRPVDGVIVMDPHVIAALMTYTGPISVPELGTTVDAAAAADFILREQYVLAGDAANPNRIDALQTLGEGVITELLTGALPAPPDLARDLGPLVEERRLLVWTKDPEEQALLDRTGLLGSLPALEDAGGFSVSVTNAVGNKIDVFLERMVSVSMTDTESGRRLVADVTFENSAPTAGLPRYVIGNDIGLPTGTSRLFVTFYGPSTLSAATLDGEPLALEPLPEAGWMAYGHFVEIPAGGSLRYRLEFDVQPGAGEPVLWDQPLVDR